MRLVNHQQPPSRCKCEKKIPIIKGTSLDDEKVLNVKMLSNMLVFSEFLP